MNEIVRSWLKDNQFKINSPIFGAFVSSWVLFNWDRFLLLFWGEGQLAARLKIFQDTTNFSDYEFFWYPFALTLFYVFLFPYINTFTQYLSGHAAKLSHKIAVNIDIEKEKKLVELNEEKYKSDPANSYLAKKIQFELDKQEAEAKKVIAEAVKKKADANKIAADAKKNILESETAELVLVKQQQKAEKVNQTHELAKKAHLHKLTCLRFPLAYQYIKTLSDELVENQQLAKLDTLAKAVATVFGYKTVDELFNDENFNQESVESLSFVFYESTELLEKLRLIVSEDGEDGLDEGLLFDCVIETFDTLSYCKLLSDESINEEASIYIDDNSSDILQLDAVTGEISVTNAFFNEVNEFEVTESKLNEQAQQYEVKLCGSVSGSNIEDKMFNGDTIDVSFTLAYPSVLGERGLGVPKIEDVSAAVSHPDDHSYR
jgi:predicted protein tyrosine phosphatase